MEAATPAPPPAPLDVDALLKEARELHKHGQLEPAIQAYRRVLAERDHHQAAILLANLLLTAPPPSPLQAAPRRAEALALAERALAAADGVAHPGDRAMLLARYGLFVMQSHGLMASVKDDDGGGDGSGALTADPGSPLGRAMAALEAAVALDASIPIAWRNLSVCYKALRRNADSEAAMAKACAAAGPHLAPHLAADLLYRHANALKRVGRLADAAGRYCDVLAADPTHAVAAYWLRVLLAAGADKGQPLPSAVADRARAALAALAGAGAPAASSSPSSAPAASAPAVPHEYIRKLFNGYSKTFDDHLVTHLHYRTPAALLALALQAAGLRPDAPAATWARCGDLGCGTGLAGVEFRPWVRFLTGCDLSGGMVAEARKRVRTAAAPSSSPQPLYDGLDVDEVEAWMRKQAGVIAAAANAAGNDGDDAVAAAARAAAAAARCESAPTGPYDLLLCADVLVYIGDLSGVFATAAGVMAPRAAPGDPPPLFVLSTESEPEAAAGASDGPGFRLTGTGRCSHRRSYVVGTAQAAGFRLVAAVTQPIRKNRGEDVTGDLYVFERV